MKPSMKAGTRKMLSVLARMASPASAPSRREFLLRIVSSIAILMKRCKVISTTRRESEVSSPPMQTNTSEGAVTAAAKARACAPRPASELMMRDKTTAQSINRVAHRMTIARTAISGEPSKMAAMGKISSIKRGWNPLVGLSPSNVWPWPAIMFWAIFR